jgi:hypothetical protein
MGNGLGAMVFIAAGITLGYLLVTGRLGSAGKGGSSNTTAPPAPTVVQPTTVPSPSVMKNSLQQAQNAAGDVMQPGVQPGW